MQFTDLRLAEPILRALTAEGYTTPTPIQAQAIPHVLEGKDLLGVAQTGTGKTAAFALPIIDRLSKHAGSEHNQQPGRGRPIRCLVLSPTRELAVQIADSFKAYGKHTGLRNTVIFGGVGQGTQVQALRNGVDVVIATPGRLLDLMQQGFIDLRQVEAFVLDEADRMLDMGFIHDIRKIIPKLPPKRQNLMFSATMPREISDLAHTILRNPTKVEVTPVSSTAERIDQSVYFVEKRNKPVLLAHLIQNTPIARALVFTRTKHGADRVVRQLERYEIKAEAIHGNKSQNARQRALGNFKSGKTAVLIASDIAARGIDIDEISLVVNFDLPNEPETYVHRIGRTARAGASGKAVSFCDSEEKSYLNAIQRLIKREIPIKKDHPQYPATSPVDALVNGHGPRPMRNTRDQQQKQRAAQAPSHRQSHGPSGHGSSSGHAPASRSGHAPAARSGHAPASRSGHGPAKHAAHAPSHSPSHAPSHAAHPQAKRSAAPAGQRGSHNAPNVGGGVRSQGPSRRTSKHPLAGRGKRFGHAGGGR